MITVETVLATNYNLAVFGIVGTLAMVVLLFDLFTKKRLTTYVRTWGLWIMLIIVFISSALTLVYSEVFGILPCGFCWLERVFIYSQIVILAVALYMKDTRVAIYTLWLSIVGGIIALYHHYIQMGGSEFVSCPTSDTGASCAERFLFEFNFITFPLLAVIAFGLIATISLYILKTNSVRLDD